MRLFYPKYYHLKPLKKLNAIVISITLCCPFGSINSQNISKKAELYEQLSQTKEPRTVLMYRKGWEMSYPAFDINSSDKLILRFDMLGTEEETLEYTIYQYDALWQKRNNDQFEYLRDLTYGTIYDVVRSFNTTVDYVHYNVSFPNDEIKITRSGNYKIVVYRNGDPEDVVLNRRFMVYDQSAAINIDKANMKDLGGMGVQNLDMTLNIGQLNVVDPHNEIKVLFMKNGNWQKLKQAPSFEHDGMSTLRFRFDNGIKVNGGNEYRYFFNKSVKYTNERIEDIQYDAGYFNIYLREDKLRDMNPYFYYEEIDGLYVIENKEGWDDPHTEANYTFVHFIFNTQQPILSNIYLFGAFTDWQFKPEAQMFWNPDKEIYENSMLLKQGYYNYRYVMKDRDAEPDWFQLEGSHYETQNKVLIMVYKLGRIYDYEELVGFEIVNTLE